MNETGIPVLEDIADYDAYAASLGIKYVKYTEKTANTRENYAEYKGIADPTDDAAIVNAWNFDNGTALTVGDILTVETGITGLTTKYYLGTATPVTDLKSYGEYLGYEVNGTGFVNAADEVSAKAALDSGRSRFRVRTSPSCRRTPTVVILL